MDRFLNANDILGSCPKSPVAQQKPIFCGQNGPDSALLRGNKYQKKFLNVSPKLSVKGPCLKILHNLKESEQKCPTLLLKDSVL